MIHISICDDSRTEITTVASHVRTWAETRDISARVSEYESAESLLFDYAEDSAVDILLLDIQMGGMDGVSLAKKIRGVNKEIQIIFITGYMDYIADGYDVEALHYLLKPVSGEKLLAVLDRALEKLARNERVLLISQGGENVRVPLYSIRYLEVWHNDVTIHADNNYTIRAALGALAEKLDDRFFRAGRSHIVNLNFVRKTTKTEVHLADGTVLPLSRGLYEALNRALIERL